MDVSESDIQDLIERHDEDHNGQIDFSEFKTMMMDIMGPNENSAE
jgi:Ca2+-binding EF-hand superfamily protein